METFKDIDEYDGDYQISNFGNVKSLKYYHGKYERILKIKINKYGYSNVALYMNKKRKDCLVHRLVAEAFIPNSNPNNKKTINHINGIKNDNRVENLEWCTASENQLHAYKTGLQLPTIITEKGKQHLRECKQGENSEKAKLKNEDVINIRKLYSEGVTQKQLAINYNVRIPNISRIVNYKRWKHI